MNTWTFDADSKIIRFYTWLWNANPYPNASDTMHYELHTAWDEGYAEGFAAGRAAATPDPTQVSGPKVESAAANPTSLDPAAATPDPLTFDSLARAALLPAASADKGWSPGIDDPEPPALGDIDTGEGWYQT